MTTLILLILVATISYLVGRFTGKIQAKKEIIEQRVLERIDAELRKKFINLDKQTNEFLDLLEKRMEEKPEGEK